MYGYVYITTNLINGKKYIGQHHSNIFTESYKGSGKILWYAIEKYGWNNFKVELLEKCNSAEELNNKEKYWISKYNAVNSEEFYNISPGGGSYACNNFPISTRMKISKSLIGNTRASGPMSIDVYNKHVLRCRNTGKDPEFRRKLSESQLRRYKSPESHKILSDAHKGKPSNTKNKIWITDGLHNTLINKNDNIPDNWYKGKTMKEGFSEIVSRTHANVSGCNNPCYGKIAINNGYYNKFIYESELDYYEKLGFTKGLLRGKSKRLNSINKEDSKQ